MSAWIEHVKKVAKSKGISYKDAMSVAKASYKPASKGKGAIGDRLAEAQAEAKLNRFRNTLVDRKKPPRKDKDTKVSSLFKGAGLTGDETASSMVGTGMKGSGFWKKVKKYAGKALKVAGIAGAVAVGVGATAVANDMSENPNKTLKESVNTVKNQLKNPSKTLKKATDIDPVEEAEKKKRRELQDKYGNDGGVLFQGVKYAVKHGRGVSTNRRDAPAPLQFMTNAYHQVQSGN